MPNRVPLPPESLSSESEHLYALLNEAEDFSAIVVAVSYIDACVASLLAGKFANGRTADELLDSRSGPIGSFVVRTKLAYVLGLIDTPMYQDLKVLAEMRNEAAHHRFKLGFDSAAIAQYTAKLKYVEGLRNGNSNEPLIDDGLLGTPRNRFALSAVMIVNRLLLKGLATHRAARGN